MLEIIVIAIGLSMDAFAVSVSSGMCIPNLKTRFALRAALFFGGFQALMPALGWLLGNSLKGLVGNFDHWIAFLLLAFIGGKMAFEAVKKLRKKAPDEACDPDEAEGKGILRLWTLLVLSVATSVDALAVGLSLSFIGLPILLSIAIIGIVTFILCFVGAEFGKRIGNAFGEWAEITGGFVLVCIGIKILAEHLAKGM